MMEFLRQNSNLLFGGGGLAGAILLALKYWRGSRMKPPSQAGTTTNTTTIQTNNVGGDVVGGNKTSGIGTLDLAIVLAAIVCITGLFLMFAPPGGNTVTASGNGVAISGDNNQVTETDSSQ